MRFYGFGNFYLSSLQQGLQAGHTIADLFVKYNHADLNAASVNEYTQPKEIELLENADMLLEWARDHKVMILLNGGNSANLQELYDFLDTNENPYPFTKFHEDEQSLNGALTYVGIILPERIYETAAKIRQASKHYYNESKLELEIVQRSFNAIVVDVNQSEIFQDFSKFEYELCLKINQFGLAR